MAKAKVAEPRTLEEAVVRWWGRSYSAFHRLDEMAADFLAAHPQHAAQADRVRAKLEGLLAIRVYRGL